ncbi:MAG: ASKHA domain-containing protein, partial [bacterium]|nr:ASKHA domain-containing protein [bacterium]
MLNTVSNSIFSNIAEYGIAIDIGTTTIAMQLIELGTMRMIDSYTALNSQRLYGADVIRRINAANHGKGEQLQKMVCNDLQQGIHTLLEKNHILMEQLRKIVIAGNTTMIHLLRQLSCETLGVYPFMPVTLERFKCQMKISEGKSGQIEVTTELGQKELGISEPYDTELNVEATILPGISTYIGGDIVAGLMACGFDQTEEIALFVDLGTNGEMAIGNQNRILCTSTAAGPAFEGGNISCGTGGIAGAVCGVTIHDGICEIQTINNQEPVGICGSGLTDAVSELLNAGVIDDT